MIVMTGSSRHSWSQSRMNACAVRNQQLNFAGRNATSFDQSLVDCRFDKWYYRCAGRPAELT